MAMAGAPLDGILPGTYTAKLTVNGQSQEQTFELKINPNETWTKADTDARFALWWRIREIFAKANGEILAAMQLTKDTADAGLKKSAVSFTNALVPAGKNLSEIANEPAKLLSKLQTVHWVLFHSEGRPPKSAYDVVDALEREIEAEIAAWNKAKNK